MYEDDVVEGSAWYLDGLMSVGGEPTSQVPGCLISHSPNQCTNADVQVPSAFDITLQTHLSHQYTHPAL